MKNIKLQFNKYIFPILLFGFVFLLPFKAEAARLYLEPAQGNYALEDNIVLEIRLDTQGECINVIKVDLNFSKDKLEAIDFSKGSSILSLWAEEPIINQETGNISFAGGIPGGFCGILPGDPGESNLLGRVIFKASRLASNQAKVWFLDSSEALLNDGLATKADLKTSGAVFSILLQEPATKKDKWAEEIAQDTISPELFEIEITQEPSIFEGKYFIIFSTVDKHTGIDYYEVEELNLIESILKKEKWQKENSPYLLSNQNSRGLIKVRAVDKAGNERIAIIKLPLRLIWQDAWVLLLIIIFGAVYWLVKRRE